MNVPARRRKPTLEQVAGYAGVSRATVSRVVNGASTVDEQLRERVQRAIEDLDYVPNAAARALMTRRTDTISLVALESDARVFSDPFFAQIVRGVSHELAGSPVRLTLSMTQNSNDVAALAKYLIGGHADGVLLISEHGSHDLASQLTAAGIPVVIGGRPLDPRVQVNYVDNDNVEAARVAAEHLRSRGCRRVATVAGPQDMSAGRDRLEGFRKGMRRDFRKSLVDFGDFTMASGEEATRRLLRRNPAFDGLFAASDLMALGAMSVLRQAGRSIPDDVRVVGFDDIELARMADPALTTMAQQTDEQGRLMARVLLKQIGHRVPELPPPTSPDGRGIILPVELVVRSSS